MLTGALAAAPRGLAQPARVRLLGYLSNGADATWLSRPLAERGHVEGRNLRIETRTAQDERSAVERLAAELVALKPDALVAFGALNVGSLAALTRTIPIVCGGTADPIGLGYAKTLRRPGRNITGLSYGVPEVAEILVGLMRSVRPRVRRILAMFGRSDRDDGLEGWGRVMRPFENAARAQAIAWTLVRNGALSELEEALAPLDPAADVVYFVNLEKSVELSVAVAAAARRRLAAFSAPVQGVRDGALIHYSIDHAQPQLRVAALVDQVLRGANPAEIPFELPDRTTFIVNRATARAIGIELSPELLARATEVIG